MTAFLYENLVAPKKELLDVGDGTQNLLLSWGTPKIVFCTHQDTVPPYIAPSFRTSEGRPLNSLSGDADPSLTKTDGQHSHSLTENFGRGSLSGNADPSVSGSVIYGRGACDAKGQIIAMYTACKVLEERGMSDFALLLLTGEETGSWGAKAFAKLPFKADYLVIGEPTENRMVSACKGTKAFELTFKGVPFHSGYPQYGHSAIDDFVDFVNALRSHEFPVDPVLGETTWNIGKLFSDNAQNVLSPELRCRLYFRTTFATDASIAEVVNDCMSSSEAAQRNQVNPIGGDSPAEYYTLEGFDKAPVSFGSDAPHLSNFRHKIICGPGSIRHAHRADEQITLAELEKAVELYLNFASRLNPSKSGT